MKPELSKCAGDGYSSSHAPDCCTRLCYNKSDLIWVTRFGWSVA